MSAPCPPIATLEEWAATGAGDPRRLHVDACPRCKSRLAAFHAFMEPGPLPVGSDLEGARRHLSAAIRVEVAARRGGQSPFSGSWRALFRPIWKPALALALISGLAVVVVRQNEQGPREIHLRGDEGALEPRLRTTIEGDAIRIEWDPLPGAERYHLLIHDEGLVLVRRLDAGAGTSLRLERAALAPLVARGDVVVLRLEAEDRDGATHFSAPCPLRMP